MTGHEGWEPFPDGTIVRHRRRGEHRGLTPAEHFPWRYSLGSAIHQGRRTMTETMTEMKLRLANNGTMRGWKFWPADPEQTIRPFGDERPSQVLFIAASQAMTDIVVHVPCNKRCGWTREIDGVLIEDHSDHTRSIEERDLPFQLAAIREGMSEAWTAAYNERAEARAAEQAGQA